MKRAMIAAVLVVGAACAQDAVRWDGKGAVPQAPQIERIPGGQVARLDGTGTVDVRYAVAGGDWATARACGYWPYTRATAPDGQQITARTWAAVDGVLVETATATEPIPPPPTPQQQAQAQALADAAQYGTALRALAVALAPFGIAPGSNFEQCRAQMKTALAAAETFEAYKTLDMAKDEAESIYTRDLEPHGLTGARLWLALAEAVK